MKIPKTISVIRHGITIETKRAHGDAPVRSRFSCLCGVGGAWTSPELANKAGDDHLEREGVS